MEREHATSCLDKFKSALVELSIKNSTYPSDFSIRTNSTKFSGRSTTISVQKSVKRCYARSSTKFILAGITRRPFRRACTHFAAVSTKQPTQWQNECACLKRVRKLLTKRNGNDNISILTRYGGIFKIHIVCFYFAGISPSLNR